MFEGIRMKQNKSNNTIFKNWRGKLSNSEQKRKRTGGRRKKKRRKNRGTRRGKNMNEEHKQKWRIIEKKMVAIILKVVK